MYNARLGDAPFPSGLTMADLEELRGSIDNVYGGGASGLDPFLGPVPGVKAATAWPAKSSTNWLLLGALGAAFLVLVTGPRR